jgi:hypothetical protein
MIFFFAISIYCNGQERDCGKFHIGKFRSCSNPIAIGLHLATILQVKRLILSHLNF